MGFSIEGIHRSPVAFGDGACKVGIEKKAFLAGHRAQAAMSGVAMKDGSFPIENREDLQSAVKAYGRAKDKTKAKKHILRRASELAMMDEVPNEWVMAAKVAADGMVSLRKYIGEEVWDSARAMGALSALQDVLSSELYEPEENGEQVAALRDAIGRVKDFIASEIKENHDAGDPASPMMLAAPTGELAKMGEALEKAVADKDALTKMVGGMQDLIKQIADRLDTLEKTPLPLPFQGGGRAVTKSEEMSRTPTASETSLEKMMDTPEGREAVSLALIKASQTNPQRMQLAR